MDKKEIMNLFEFYDNDSGAYLNNSNYKSIEKVVDNIIILYKLKNAEQEAKIYTYEKIIENSNFAPILKENKKKNKEQE